MACNIHARKLLEVRGVQMEKQHELARIPVVDDLPTSETAILVATTPCSKGKCKLQQLKNSFKSP